jgi:hypothetical protein
MGGHGRPAAEDELLHALLDRGAVKEDAAAAGKTAKADIGAEPRHLPVVTAARMGLAEPHDIAQVQLEDRFQASA